MIRSLYDKEDMEQCAIFGTDPGRNFQSQKGQVLRVQYAIPFTIMRALYDKQDMEQ